MNPKDIPPYFSRVHYAMIAGNVPQYCVSHSVNNHHIRAIQDDRGVTLRPDECRFTAMVEFHGPRHSRIGIHDPKRWWVGFVQNITGYIEYQYRNRSNQLVVKAAIGPERVPCKDSGYPGGTFYNGLQYSLKQFGVIDELADDIPLNPRHPAVCEPNVRYVTMADAPGPGNLPLDLPCREAGDRRAVVNNQYRIGWTDPLDPNRGEPDMATLRRIEGRLAFKTWLAMTCEPGGYADVRRATDLYYLHKFEWDVNFGADVNGRVVTVVPGSGARLISEGACHYNTNEPILGGPDANDSACAKFSRG